MPTAKKRSSSRAGCLRGATDQVVEAGPDDAHRLATINAGDDRQARGLDEVRVSVGAAEDDPPSLDEVQGRTVSGDRRAQVHDRIARHEPCP